jgi:hypothetical protein
MAMLFFLLVLLCSVMAWASDTEQKMVVAGVSSNVQILCNPENSDSHYWMINGSVYGLLHVPRDFLVCSSVSCDLNTLTIPVIRSEMNGLTFQCYGIDYHNNTLHLQGVTVLTVHTLPTNETSNIDGDYSQEFAYTVYTLNVFYYLQELVSKLTWKVTT